MTAPDRIQPAGAGRRWRRARSPAISSDPAPISRREARGGRKCCAAAPLPRRSSRFTPRSTNWPTPIAPIGARVQKKGGRTP